MDKDLETLNFHYALENKLKQEKLRFDKMWKKSY